MDEISSKLRIAHLASERNGGDHRAWARLPQVFNAFWSLCRSAEILAYCDAADPALHSCRVATRFATAPFPKALEKPPRRVVAHPHAWPQTAVRFSGCLHIYADFLDNTVLT